MVGVNGHGRIHKGSCWNKEWIYGILALSSQDKHLGRPQGISLSWSLLLFQKLQLFFFFILTLHFDLVPLRKMKFVLPGLFLQWLSCLLLYEHEGELSVGSVFNHIFLKSLVHALGTSTMKTVFKASHR